MKTRNLVWVVYHIDWHNMIDEDQRYTWNSNTENKKEAIAEISRETKIDKKLLDAYQYYI